MRYWAQRAAELCDEIDDTALNEPKQVVLDSVETLKYDRRVVIIGASDKAKSALLGGMIGNSVPARVTPEYYYLRWRYISDDGDYEHCRFLPTPNLCGMELVDTQGCERPEVAEAVAPLLPGADAVVAVVDARQPEASPVWEMLKGLPAEGGPACLIAYVHAEELNAEHVAALDSRMRDFCRACLGRYLPGSLIDTSNAVQTSEFGDKVKAAIESSSGGIRGAIRAVQRNVSDLLYKQGSVLKARDAIARTDNGFLQGIDSDIDEFLARQMQGVRNCVLNYASSAQRCMPELLVQLRRSMGSIFSPAVLLRLEQYASASENLYFRLVLDDITRQQEELDKQFVISCNGCWRDVRPRMNQALRCEIGEFPAEKLEAELTELRQHLQNSLYVPFRDLEIRSQFSSLFKPQVGWMRFVSNSMCFSFIIAGLLGFCSLETLAFIFVGVAGLLWMLGTMLHVLVVRKICQYMRLVADPLHEAYTKCLSEQVQNMIIARVASYRRLYAGARQRVAAYETTLEPLQKKQNEIFRLFRSAVSPM